MILHQKRNIIKRCFKLKVFILEIARDHLQTDVFLYPGRWCFASELSKKKYDPPGIF